MLASVHGRYIIYTRSIPLYSQTMTRSTIIIVIILTFIIIIFKYKLLNDDTIKIKLFSPAKSIRWTLFYCPSSTVHSLFKKSLILSIVKCVNIYCDSKSIFTVKFIKYVKHTFIIMIITTVDVNHHLFYCSVRKILLLSTSNCYSRISVIFS